MSNNSYKDWYANQPKLHVAVDCIIFGFVQGSLKLLVFQRKVEPLKGGWSLIGSFVNPDEGVDNAAVRVLYELTGLRDIFLKEVKCYGAVNRDPGARCISIAHYALINVAHYDKGLMQDYGARWFGMEELPELILDHDRMVRDARELLRREARYRPIGFELLPDRFTIPQLQALYEAIYGMELDARNFRKKVTSFGVLQNTRDKDYNTSKKGAFLYRFDKGKYNALLASGYDFMV